MAAASLLPPTDDACALFVERLKRDYQAAWQRAAARYLQGMSEPSGRIARRTLRPR